MKHHGEEDIVILKENAIDDKYNTLVSTISPPTTTTTITPTTTRPPNLSYQSYQVPQDRTSSNVLLVTMSAFSLVVFALITAGCSLGLYRKYKHPELGGSRPPSRTGTLDSRRSSGSSGSRRSRRQSNREREKEDNIYSEVRVKSGACEDDIRTQPGCRLSGSDICDNEEEVRGLRPLQISPSAQRQRVSFYSFHTSREGRLKATLASTRAWEDF